MKTIQSTDAKAHLAQLLSDVERGETITITRHGKPIARLVPAVDDEEERRRAAVAALREWRRHLPPSDITVEELLSARDEGRK
ncbi:MAG: type II toxin-antitoxin system prevent-host-death family antitoxin [Rhodospirillaceae bacterium]|nr:type II toxin-antitoxin system prevent-host-death family antitoxin [Rhodospirillaceae bacterium]